MIRICYLKFLRSVSSVLVFVFLIGYEGISQSIKGIDSSKSSCREVMIPNTELKTLRSELMNQQFNIYIKLPVNYYADSNKIYPVWYWTDANRSFPLVANIASLLEIPKTDFPDLVIVGIGYPIRDMADWAAMRTRDLTPTNDPGIDSSLVKLLAKSSGRKYEVKSGGAMLFLNFIIKELIPFVESNYRVSSSERGLGGYSYGGLFTLFALITRPEVFDRYFAGSPSLEYDKGILFKYENEFALTHKNLKATVFLTAGSLENDGTIENMKKMLEVLQSRNYQGLTIDSYVFPDESHRSCIPSAIMKSFKVLYKP
jgi:uncharacterized protein